jgi:hypothetical protein
VIYSLVASKGTGRSIGSRIRRCRLPTTAQEGGVVVGLSSREAFVLPLQTEEGAEQAHGL